MKRLIEAELLSGEALYRAVVLDKLLRARESVDISSANVKAMFVADGPARGRRGPDHKSIVEQFAKLAARGVRLRLLHAETPSRPFRQAFDQESRLVQGGLALRLCPRVHFKTVIVDRAWVYLGSANLTGAGLGAKGEHKRNFELGFVTEDFDVIDRTQALFEAIWSGAECGPCKVRELCPDPQGESTIARGRSGRGRKRSGGAGTLVQLGKSRRFGR